MVKCTLDVFDEVNVKFQGLDVKTRRKMVNALKFFIPHAKYLPSYKLGRWDGTKSFCTTGSRTNLNLLDFHRTEKGVEQPSILDIITGAGYDIEFNDMRTPINLDFQKITEETFADTLWPKDHPAEGEPVILRDYQVDIINKFLENPQCVQEIATGAGKTLITAALSKTCEKFGRTVVIVPNRDLVTQTEEDYRNLGLDVGVFYGGRNEWNKTHTICTWQSLSRLDQKTKDHLTEEDIYEFLDNVNCVIVDECFDGDTLITMADGSKKPIKNICKGDTILNYSEKTDEFKTDVVADTYKNMTKTSNEKMYELTFNTNTVKVTGNHKFLTKNRGWVRADDLTEDDDIVNNC